MADLVGLCEQQWNETVLDGNFLISCPTDQYQLITRTEAASQPDLMQHFGPVATCESGFQEIISGASHTLTCSENDFLYISRTELLQTTGTDHPTGHMSQIQFDQLWLLIFISGLLIVFGLGAIKGGQR